MKVLADVIYWCSNCCVAYLVPGPSVCCGQSTELQFRDTADLAKWGSHSWLPVRFSGPQSAKADWQARVPAPLAE